ncbi:MAG: hypothetical protein INR63_20550 [Actinomycetospora chiangmaiensis]|nr:hypothetical protein [Actinomycetospora chiangmaiensis]
MDEPQRRRVIRLPQVALIGVAVGFGTLLSEIPDNPSVWSWVAVAVLVATMGVLAHTRQLLRHSVPSPPPPDPATPPR